MTLVEICFVGQVKMELLRAFAAGRRGRPSAEPREWETHDLIVVTRTGLVEPFRLLSARLVDQVDASTRPGGPSEADEPPTGGYTVEVTAPDGRRAVFRGDMNQWRRFDSPTPTRADVGRLVTETLVVNALFMVAAEAGGDEGGADDEGSEEDVDEGDEDGGEPPPGHGHDRRRETPEGSDGE